MNKIAVVIEDDVDLRDYIKKLLGDNGFVVHTLGDGTKALDLVEKTQPDVVLLDLGLPTVKGEAVCADIKKSYPEIPVIILTARDGVSDVVNGLNLGADDYMTKPFAGEELIARMHARLRANRSDDNRLEVDDLTLDPKTLNVKRGSKELQLTAQEFKILEYLMANKGRVVTREMILTRLWQTNPDVETRVVDVYIGYLRKKIDKGSGRPLIQSVRGFGYKIG